MSRRPFREGRNVSIHGEPRPREHRRSDTSDYDEADAAPNPLQQERRTRRPPVSDMTTDLTGRNIEADVGNALDRFFTELLEWPAFRSLGNPRIEALTRDVRLKILGELQGDLHNLQSLNDPKTKLTTLLNDAAALIKTDPALSAVVRNHPLFVTARSATVHWDASLPKAAPELWNARPRQDKRTATEFLEQVYADWLPTPLTLTFLRSLDQPLHSTLSTWLARNRGSVPSRLQAFFAGGKAAREAALDREIEELGIKEPADVFAKLPNDRKRADRLYQAILRRRRKSHGNKHILT